MERIFGSLLSSCGIGLPSREQCQRQYYAGPLKPSAAIDRRPKAEYTPSQNQIRSSGPRWTTCLRRATSGSRVIGRPAGRSSTLGFLLFLVEIRCLRASQIFETPISPPAQLRMRLSGQPKPSLKFCYFFELRQVL